MTILITGSSGKTARRLVNLLKPSYSILIASRSGEEVNGISAVKFDWADAKTYDAPYEHPQATKSPINAVYLVSQPGVMHPFATMKPFIDAAKKHGVRRFVLLSAIREDETTPGTGQIHAYLKKIEVEWAVLRPTFFMENFSEQQHLPTIRDESSIFSATEDGQISFVSTEDIAAIAYRALTDETPHNRDYVIVGPELLSHDNVAAILTEVLGRDISHIRISRRQLVDRFTRFGIPQSYAERISDGEVRASTNEFGIINDVVFQITGQKPLTLRTYAEKNKNAWRK